MAVGVLDNPVWSSMRDAHTTLADVGSVDGGGAGVYRPDVAPFGAVEDPDNPACWSALAALLDGRTTALVLGDPAVVPGGWEVAMEIPGVQMDGSALEVAEDGEAVRLTGADVPEMLALVERARPGPFLPRTVEMGNYLGIRDDGGVLIAMAGERLHPTGWTEISAVCTDAAYRARGLGTRLVRAVAAGIRARGEVPFLHASAENVNAIRLYESLGFTLRRKCSFTIVKKS
jgi:ribosomal protein S18 acetylase RimI-like enzyme